jgi:ribonuclease P/MRP protein subunit POP8
MATDIQEEPSDKPSERPKFHQKTLHNPRWTYIRLTLILPNNPSSSQQKHASTTTTTNTETDNSPDLLTLHSCIFRALKQYLGTTGAAIPVDVLKHERQELWIRVPREDGQAVVAALGGWVGNAGDGTTSEMVGWRVNCWGNWLGALVGDGGQEAVFAGE